MWTYNHTNELAHHGTKGMRWGVRRYQNKDGSLTPEGKKRYGDDHEDHRKTYRQNVRTMSDKELRDALNRLNMEKQYSQLTAREKSAGRKWVESLFIESSKEIAKSYVTKYGKKGIELGVKTLVDLAAKKKTT